VHQVVVVARREGTGEPRLVAYFVGDHSTKAADLREFLRSKLPEHMIPYAYVELDTLPLTINGKIDRAALPPPPLPSATESETTRTQLERSVADIWCQVLNIARVGPSDNFFDLGGDSLLLGVVHTNLQKALQTEISITDLFEFPTVGSLARHLDGKPPSESFILDARQRAQKQRAAFARQHRRNIGSAL
jgi:acyl carrier protein